MLLSHAGHRRRMAGIRRAVDRRRRDDRLCDRLGRLSADHAAGDALARSRPPLLRLHGPLQLVPSCRRARCSCWSGWKPRAACSAPQPPRSVEAVAVIAVLVYEWYIARVALDTNSAAAATLVVVIDICLGEVIDHAAGSLDERRLFHRANAATRSPQLVCRGSSAAQSAFAPSRSSARCSPSSGSRAVNDLATRRGFPRAAHNAGGSPPRADPPPAAPT